MRVRALVEGLRAHDLDPFVRTESQTVVIDSVLMVKFLHDAFCAGVAERDNLRVVHGVVDVEESGLHGGLGVRDALRMGHVAPVGVEFESYLVANGRDASAYCFFDEVLRGWQAAFIQVKKGQMREACLNKCRNDGAVDSYIRRSVRVAQFDVRCRRFQLLLKSTPSEE